jgi:hypothetical protein
VSNVIQDLLKQVKDPIAFDKSFGCSADNLEAIDRLIEAKTLTIGRLMEFVPAGTVDPTPFIYDTTCYAPACLMTVSFISNLAIRPLDVVSTLDELNNKEGSCGGDDEAREPRSSIHSFEPRYLIHTGRFRSIARERRAGLRD